MFVISFSSSFGQDKRTDGFYFFRRSRSAGTQTCRLSEFKGRYSNNNKRPKAENPKIVLAMGRGGTGGETSEFVIDSTPTAMVLNRSDMTPWGDTDPA